MKMVQIGGSIIQVLWICLLIGYVGKPQAYLHGVLYITVAAYLALYAVIGASKVRTTERKGARYGDEQVSRKRPTLLLNLAWQVAIIGWLNIWPFTFVDSPASVLLGYAIVGLFAYLCQTLVGSIDDPDQAGGSMPMVYFGFKRSRKLLFWCLVYVLLVPSTILSLEWSRYRWCPLVLKAPTIWVLQCALLSSFVLLLALQRYRKEIHGNTLRGGILFVTIGFIIGSTGIQLVFPANFTGYLVSISLVISIAISAYLLLYGKLSQSL